MLNAFAKLQPKTTLVLIVAHLLGIGQQNQPSAYDKTIVAICLTVKSLLFWLF